MPKGIRLITSVWGREFIGNYLDVSLPALLAEKNLPALGAVAPLCANIITDKAGFAALDRSDAVKALRQIADVDIVIMEEEDSDSDHYDRVARMHNNSLKSAHEVGEGALILSPDLILSDGTLESLGKAIQQGKRVGIIFSMRVNGRSFKSAIAERLEGRLDIAFSLPPREMVALMLEHLHPFSKTLFTQAERVSTCCHDMYWNVTPNYLVARGFHLCPIYIEPRELPLMDDVTFDILYPSMSNPDPEDWFIFDDSDHGIMADLTKPGAMLAGGMKDGPVVPADAAAFAEMSANAAHREFFRNPIRVHSEPLTPDQLTFDPSAAFAQQVEIELNWGWLALYFHDSLRFQNRLLMTEFCKDKGLPSPNRAPAVVRGLVSDTGAKSYGLLKKIKGLKRAAEIGNTVRRAKEPDELAPIVKIQARLPEKRGYFFPVPVWGKVHSHIFTEFSLPTQLADGNLPALAAERQCIYKIFTTEESANRITQARSYQELCQVMKVELETVDDLPEFVPSRHPWELSSMIYQRAIEDPHIENNGMFLLCPDHIIANGSLAALHKTISEGSSAVFMSVLRTQLETILYELKSAYKSTSDYQFNIDKRAMVDLGLRHLHPVSRMSTVGSSSLTPGLSQLIWLRKNRTAIIRNWHWHPVFLDIPSNPPKFSGTIDHGLAQIIAQNAEKFHVVHDSDEAVAFEMSGMDKRPALVAETLEPVQTAIDWAKDNTSEFHREMVANECVLHADDLDDEDRALIAEAEVAGETMASAFAPIPPVKIPKVKNRTTSSVRKGSKSSEKREVKESSEKPKSRSTKTKTLTQKKRK
jgi:hypothetical protein